MGARDVEASRALTTVPSMRADGRMDAVTTLTPNPDDELRELRRRAYGPDSSGLSPEELSRLEALEVRARETGQVEAPPAEVPAVATPATDAPVEIAPAAAASAASAADEPATPLAAEAPAVPTVSWRRWPLWIAAGVGVAVGVVVTLGVTTLGERAPDETLRQVETAPLPSIGGYSSELDQDTLRSYEEWNAVSLWTVERADGATCLVLSAGGDDDPAGWFGNVQCTMDGLDPQIDFTVWQGLGEMIGSDLPSDSTVRFVARHGVVDVWVDTAGGVIGS